MDTSWIGTVWPYVLALGGFYAALLKVIQSMYEARIRDLTAERDRWEAFALQSLQVAKTTTDVAKTVTGGTP